MSGSKPTKVPRASFGVTVLDDPDYMVLVSSGKDGRAAFAAFVALVLAAKLQKNGGTFREPIEVVAGMCRWPAQDFVKALDAIDASCKRNGNTPWVVRRQDRLVIRNFEAWHNPKWGGQRPGTGGGKRKAAKDQVGDQVGFKTASNGRASVSVPVPDSASDDPEEKEKSAASAAASPNSLARRSPRKADLIWDQVVEVFGIKVVTEADQKRVGRIVRDLSAKGATPDSIYSAVARYENEWPNVECTPEALLKHWDRFATNELVSVAEACAERDRQETQRMLAEQRGERPPGGSATA